MLNSVVKKNVSYREALKGKLESDRADLSPLKTPLISNLGKLSQQKEETSSNIHSLIDNILSDFKTQIVALLHKQQEQIR